MHTNWIPYIDSYAGLFNVFIEFRLDMCFNGEMWLLSGKIVITNNYLFFKQLYGVFSVNKVLITIWRKMLLLIILLRIYSWSFCMYGMMDNFYV